MPKKFNPNIKQLNVRFDDASWKDLKRSWKVYNRNNIPKLSFNAFLKSLLIEKVDKPKVDCLFSQGGKLFYIDNKGEKTQITSSDPLSPKVPLGSRFVDDRGIIQNILNTDLKAISIIESKAGSTRSNHWHEADWHYLFVLEGKMEYWERNMDHSDSKMLIVNKGEMIFTAPKKVHKTIFLEDTTLLSLGNYVNHDADTNKEIF